MHSSTPINAIIEEIRMTSMSGIMFKVLTQFYKGIFDC